MSLRVLRLAAGATFQDLGRPGFRRFGVPPGGAFDCESHRLALALAGHGEGATLEIPIPGAEFEAVAEDRLAIVGADVPVRCDGQSLACQASFLVSPGQRLTIGPADRGLRAYLASARGWKVAEVLGSVSGERPGPDLATDSPMIGPGRTARLAVPPTSLDRGPIRILPGPQATLDDLQVLAHTKFLVGLNSNRVGIRLEGGEFAPRGELASEPSVLGAIQLAPSGELLLHGPDGPTIGGYPKIAVVAEVDRGRLAQLRPSGEVRFEAVDPHAARELLKDHEGVLTAVLRDLAIVLTR